MPRIQKEFQSKERNEMLDQDKWWTRLLIPFVFIGAFLMGILLLLYVVSIILPIIDFFINGENSLISALWKENNDEYV